MVDYQSVGSGSGVRNFINKTVDFGASDAAMTPEQISQVDVGAVLLPMTAGSIVLAYNLPGVSELKLSRQAYSGIFLGKVTKWNDPLIAKTNPGVKLPDSPINVVVRADSSGTTNVFTKHLSAISPEFAKSPGVNNMPNWPVGTRSKGNEGVTASILTTPGAIGYIEYGYAVGQQVPMATLENKAGKFVKPTIASAKASLAAVKLPETLIAWLPDPDGVSSYPIVTFTWMLFYKKYDPAKLKAVKDMAEYCLTEGQKSSQQLGYIPLPPSVVAKDKAALKAIVAK
jgi:phosphate transport system substrate-binding protein